MAALAQAESLGLLVRMPSLPAAFRQQLEKAIAMVQQARAAHLESKLAALRCHYPDTEFARVDRCVRIFLGREPMPSGHRLQRPTFMSFPGLPAQAWFERNQFPWLEEIERHTGGIRAELYQVLQEQQGFQPFVEIPEHHQAAAYWQGLNYSPNWNAYFFYRDGRRYDDNCRRCPLTSTLLDSLPLCRVDEHSPEVFFSVLKPGAHIPRHTGVINTRLVTHLPLVIPDDCGIRVGDETRGWKPGECLVFDDTFEHEAWNRSSQTRVVLIFDLWNPYLSELEQQAMRVIVEELGRFNREHGQ
ncbi:MAG: aspartyl/asparaginyl beta-hydroxylase domain-containing protein [Gammaproteobacteria bacterium]|nr:aspartyl/asparaginyl beta-hydroxylase domain-containing protein [Gammaproteobacteria bacterium]